jgi:pectate lyase
MLYWGGHTSYDLLEDGPLIGNHELKCVYPYYSFLYKVDPKATSLLIEGFWNKHVKNWPNLLFNRHGEYTYWDRSAPWEHDYSGGPLPIIDNTMLSFINTGSDLIYSGALLARLSGNSEPLTWAKRLARRYDEVRYEATGLGGYQFNHREPCRVRISFKKPLSEREDVNETTVITNGVIQTRYGRAALTWLNLFEELGADGQMFLDIASRDLTAIGEHAYDSSDGSFSPLLVDGMKLSPSDCMEGVGYCNPRKLEKVPANGLMFLVYSKAYRIANNRFFWQMTRSLAQGIGLEEVFSSTDEQSAELRNETSGNPRISLPATSVQNHACTLLGLIELYKATEQEKYLTSAIDLGNQLVQKYFADRFFTAGAETDGRHASIDNSLPLALLHLAAIAEGKHTDLPVFYPNSTSFDPKVIIARRKRK